MAKRKWIMGQTMVCKTLHRKLKDFHEAHTTAREVSNPQEKS